MARWVQVINHYKNSVEGQFWDYILTGSGVKKWADGRRYWLIDLSDEGEFKGNELHGIGIRILADGRKYECQLNVELMESSNIIK